MIYQDDADGICVIDTGYLQSQTAAAYLIVEQGRAAFIDTGTNYSVSHLLATLADKKMAVSDVDFVILTHIHLDHAGGAGQLMLALPNAQLVVHPRGMRHMVDPGRLVDGAVSVYGQARFSALYGDILAVDMARITQATDQTRLDLGGRELLCLDTPGHAQHHICIWDAKSKSMFTGDTFGVSYPEFHQDKGRFIFPTTTPVQFDPGALHASIKRLLSYAPEQMYLTHYGAVRGDLLEIADDLHALIDGFVVLVREAGESKTREADLIEQMQRLLWQRWQDQDLRLSEADFYQRIEHDVLLNVQGLLCWWDKTQAVYG